MYAKIEISRFSAFALKAIANGHAPDMRVYLKSVGATSFAFSRPMFGLAMGWIDVPKGSCITLLNPAA